VRERNTSRRAKSAGGDRDAERKRKDKENHALAGISYFLLLVPRR